MVNEARGIGPGTQSLIQAFYDKLKAGAKQALGPGNPAADAIQAKTAQTDPVKNQLDIIAQQAKSPGLGKNLDVLGSYLISAGIFYQSIAAKFGEHISQAQDYMTQTQDALYTLLRNYS